MLNAKEVVVCVVGSEVGKDVEVVSPGVVRSGVVLANVLESSTVVVFISVVVSVVGSIVEVGIDVEILKSVVAGIDEVVEDSVVVGTSVVV